MIQKVALVGLSGVGKTTFLQRTANYLTFTHLEASQILKEELAKLATKEPTSEELRTGAVRDNQRILIEGFNRKSLSSKNLIVLDAHTVIDTGKELQKISATVFGEMGIEKMIFLEAAPEDILQRRLDDTGRKRPVKTLQEIDSQQTSALQQARQITRILNIPLLTVTDKTSASDLANYFQSGCP